MDPIGHDLERHDLERHDLERHDLERHDLERKRGGYCGLLFVVAFLLLIIIGRLWLQWKSGELRRFALHSLGQLDAALCAGNSGDLVKLVSHFRPNPAAPLGKHG